MRIQHLALGTLAGLVIAVGTLQLKMGDGVILTGMLVVTLAVYLVLRKNYGLAMTGMTVVTVYTLQLLSLNGAHFLLPRLVDALIGCMLAFGGTLWLWPQWQSGLLRKKRPSGAGAGSGSAAAAATARSRRARVSLCPHAGQSGA